MKASTFLLSLTSFFGIAVFSGVFLLAPSPFAIRIPFVQKVFLPAAGERAVTIPSAPSETTLVFVGDVMMGRKVEQTIALQGTAYPFSDLGDLFTGANRVVGNFEATIRDTPRIEVTNEMLFDVTPANAAMLAGVGFTDLSLANNHSDDFGASVTTATRSSLQSLGFTTFGDGYASQNFIAREEASGLRLSLIGYNAFGDDPEAIGQAIKNEKSIGQFVIVMPHWGVEYVLTPSSSQITTAQDFADAGADLIIGGHPHVIESVDVIGSTPVVYSMGNFLFDQNWSRNTQQGMTVRVTITDSDIALKFIPVNVIDEHTTQMTPEEAAPILERLGYPDGQLTVARQTSADQTPQIPL